jgi:hypothetical protein
MGNLYGESSRTDSSGGYGTLFELTPNGTFIRLRAMDLRTGANPSGGMAMAGDGNLYGTDSAGGASTWGAIFSLKLATPPTLTPASLSNLFEGISSNLVVARLNGGVAPFSASIDWGDGTMSPGGLSSTGEVSGTHTWAEESPTGQPYMVTVTITDSAAQTATATDAAIVVDAALNAGPPATIDVVGYNATIVATFSDDNAGAPLSDFTATIDWGDGLIDVGTVSGTGPFTVTGSHTYAVAGSYAISVAIMDIGGSILTISGTATILG